MRALTVGPLRTAAEVSPGVGGFAPGVPAAVGAAPAEYRPR